MDTIGKAILLAFQLVHRRSQSNLSLLFPKLARLKGEEGVLLLQEDAMCGHPAAHPNTFKPQSSLNSNPFHAIHPNLSLNKGIQLPGPKLKWTRMHPCLEASAGKISSEPKDNQDLPVNHKKNKLWLLRNPQPPSRKKSHTNQNVS